MVARRHERTYARKQAIQALYQAEILEVSPASLLDDAGSFVDEAAPSQYASMLVRGVADHHVAIDSLLKRYSENWAIDRMPMVDRAILRLSCFEMGYVDEVPVSVTINEAVELAKEFGGEDDSARFVNGVLGRVAEYLEEHGCMPDAKLQPYDASDLPSGNREGGEGAAVAFADGQGEE
jgi:N utilization substance protein B